MNNNYFSVETFKDNLRVLKIMGGATESLVEGITGFCLGIPEFEKDSGIAKFIIPFYSENDEQLLSMIARHLKELGFKEIENGKM